MKGNYRVIQFDAGQNIESAIKMLKRHNGLVCGSFNGQMLYSDIDDVDSAYKKIMGQTKAEFDAEMKAENGLKNILKSNYVGSSRCGWHRKYIFV